MGAKLDTKKLGFVFQTRPDILEGIQKAADSPSRVALFNQIATHVYDTIQGNGEPAHKKRRVDVDQANGSANGTHTSADTITNAADEAVLLEIKEISVSVPQRKKFELCFTANHFYARAPGTTAPIPAITHAWKDIEYIFYLPVPEKTQVQHNYIVFPRGTCLPSKTNPPSEEPLVFTVPSTAPKQGTVGGPEAGTASAVSDTYKSLFHWALNRHLRPAGNDVEIVSANPNKFQSMVKQPHRPNEKAVHVKAFRGSKDGYLFFLENGILWGFKKPLMFIPLNRIAATSYTSILQRTFNIAVEVFASEGDATEELEFSMLDQEDYGGIDEYIRRNKLQDRSMAEQRKAKLELAENKGPKKGGDAAENGDAAVADGAEGQGGMSELQKAHLELEQQLDDEEDEDEEDYDPGSEGESEGSGESDDDDDSDDEDDEDDEGEDDGEEAEGEGEEEAEEESVKEEPVKEEPVQPVKPARRARATKPARATKATPVKAAPVKTAPVKAAPVKAAPVKAAPVKAAPVKATTVPVKSGWATIGGSRRNDDDMDVDETFDVVG
ncbi:hypothetical protein BKA56DRAFT_642386 [Ilyonectria sp. MPI-CAGE-AT-0026]|nr:hypothetical protein BKA56DRAFT_642386 [Ilyonectria sp. MPI-CAGE-AT-0026]